MSGRRSIGVLVAAVLATACVEGSALAPATPEAARIAGLWWFLLAAGTAVYVLVMVLLAVALSRRRHRGPEDATADPHADGSAQRRLVVLGGIVLPLAVVVTVVVAGAVVGRAVAPSATQDEVTVEVLGWQFWWRVVYPDHAVVTANEIHVPTGTPVRLRLRSADVIHSFWVPPLHGKIDLRPGAETELTFTVDDTGVYRGRCAEYCGLAHAQMELLVVAHEPEEFAAWVERHAADAGEPATVAAARGRDLFASSCAACHQVRGHTPTAELGPDLTHLTSRATLAAGTIPNELDQLRRWIRAPHAVKPGVAMPPSDLEGRDLDDLLAYLEGLE